MNRRPTIAGSRASSRWLLAGLLVGAALRLSALSYPGTGDVAIWKIWAFGASRDLTASYGIGGSPPQWREIEWETRHITADYPPLALEIFALVGHAYRLIDPAFRDTPTLTAFVKAPALVWDVTMLAVLLGWGRRRCGESAAVALALTWWLNPAVILNASVFGYLDLMAAVPAFLALVAAWERKSWLAGALLAVAVLTKQQAVFAGPAVAFVIWHRAVNRRQAVLDALATASLAAVLAIGPFVARGAAPNLIRAVFSITHRDIVSGDAANLWWIVTWILRVQDSLADSSWWDALTLQTRLLNISSVMNLGYPNVRPIGMALMLTALAWGCWRARRTSSLVVGAALVVWCVHAYVMLSAQVHENHLSFLLPFALFAGAMDPRLRALAWSLSAIAALNLVLFYGMAPFHAVGLSRRSTVIDATVLLAVANVGVFVWHASTLRRLTASEPARPAVRAGSPA